MATGRIKWFDAKKAVGFIVPEGGGDDLYFTAACLLEPDWVPEEGGQVSYEIDEAARGLMAVEIRPFDAAEPPSVPADTDDMHLSTPLQDDTAAGSPEREEPRADTPEETPPETLPEATREQAATPPPQTGESASPPAPVPPAEPSVEPPVEPPAEPMATDSGPPATEKAPSTASDSQQPDSTAEPTVEEEEDEPFELGEPEPIPPELLVDAPPLPAPMPATDEAPPPPEEKTTGAPAGRESASSPPPPADADPQEQEERSAETETDDDDGTPATEPAHGTAPKAEDKEKSKQDRFTIPKGWSVISSIRADKRRR